jgi:hypothetical protein
VNSVFGFGKGPGAFRAGGSIFSTKTDAALIEFMKELKGIEGERPITDEELKTAKDNLIQGLPARFAVNLGDQHIDNIIDCAEPAGRLLSELREEHLRSDER